MKKLIASLASIALLVALLAGCGSTSTANSNTASTNTNENVTQTSDGTSSDSSQQVEDTVWVPEKDVTMVVPFDAGGGVDLVGRALADALSNYWGVNVVVENMGGGGSLVGCSSALARPADGYTICMMTDSLVLSPYSTESGITLDQYTPLAQITISSPTMTINADLPYETLEEFMDAVKADPGGFNMGTVGAKGIWAIFAQSFANQYGLEFTMVPYDSGNEAQLAVAGGHLECTMQNAAEVVAQVEAGALRTLCVFGEERDPALPDVPTAQELGIDYATGSFRGVMVANGIDEDIMAGLSAGIEAAIQSPDFVSFMESQGLPISYMNSDEFAAKLVDLDGEFETIFAEWDE